MPGKIVLLALLSLSSMNGCRVSKLRFINFNKSNISYSIFLVRRLIKIPKYEIWKQCIMPSCFLGWDFHTVVWSYRALVNPRGGLLYARKSGWVFGRTSFFNKLDASFQIRLAWLGFVFADKLADCVLPASDESSKCHIFMTL